MISTFVWCIRYISEIKETNKINKKTNNVSFCFGTIRPEIIKLFFLLLQPNKGKGYPLIQM